MFDPTSSLSFALSITLPIFIVLFIGTWLRKIGLITDAFVDVGSKLVFNVTLPALLFVSIVNSDINFGKSLSLVIYGILSTIVVYILLEIAVPFMCKDRSSRGVMVQGAFRGNMGIIGLAYCVNAYGDAVYSTAAIYIALVTIFYNIFSVTTLTRWSDKNSNSSKIAMIKSVLLGVAKNPLIIAIACALIINQLHVPIPEIIQQSGQYFARMTLPLALLVAGAGLSLKFNADLTYAAITTTAKLIVIPMAVTAVAWLLDFKGMELGVIFLMSSAPSASASFVMARSIGGNYTLAANIIVLTTVLSLFTTSTGTALLRSWSLM